MQKPWPQRCKMVGRSHSGSRKCIEGGPGYTSLKLTLSESLPLIRLCLQKILQPPNAAPLARDQMFEHMSPQRTFCLQTTTGGYNNFNPSSTNDRIGLAWVIFLLFETAAPSRRILIGTISAMGFCPLPAFRSSSISTIVARGR